MSTLAITSCIVGVIYIILYAVALVVPAKFREGLQRFPRSVWPGRILTLVDLIWVTYVILHASLGNFEFLKPAVYIAAPLAYLAIVFLMDELLSPRALGGLLLLVANPVLNIARWNPSTWRLVLVVLAYMWVIIGIVLVLSPYRFRKVTGVIYGTDGRCRIMGFLGTAVGVLLVVLGFTVF